MTTNTTNGSMKFTRICVYCGARDGTNPEFLAKTVKLAEEFARRNINLVYGGGGVGIMAHIAKECLKRGLEVDGVMPRTMVKVEFQLDECTRFHEVTTMHERKALMNDLSDGFIALPGGIGTLDELFEAWTWAHLGVHNKPIGILNVDGYYDKLIEFLDHSVACGLLPANSRKMVVVSEDPSELLDQMEQMSNQGILDWKTDHMP